MFKIKLYTNNLKFEHNLTSLYRFAKAAFFKMIPRMNLINHIFNMRI